MAPPACRKCGNYHWRFIRCDERLDYEKERAARHPKVEWANHEGFRAFGDRFDGAYQHLGGGNLVLRKDK